MIKKLQFNSLKTILSAMVVAIMAVMTVIIIIVAYGSSYGSVEDAYMNQLLNFNRDIENQIVRFYDQQVNTVVFFSKNKTVIDAVETNNFENTDRMFTAFSQEQKIYENILISTAENNPRIVSAVAGIGTKWGNTGYDDNLKNNLNGNVYVSDPHKSPVTGMPVSLFSAPIKKGNAVIGIVALAVNVGEFSNQIIKDIKIAETGFPYLVTLDGIVFAHPKKEYILNFDVKKYDWGKELLEAKDGEVISYSLDGVPKILTTTKNEKYRFITGVTIGKDDINAEARSLAVKLILLALFSIVIAGGVIFYAIKKRLSPLDDCRDLIKRMAGGDLSGRYAGKIYNDEIGEIVESVNSAMDQFEKTISAIIVASQNVAQAVEQIASGNQNLSQRTSEQASSLEEIAATVEEASATVTQNAENAANARDLTTAGADKSTMSNKIAVEAVNSIMEMNDSSKKVSDIIAVINEIAFQTNLLALNAAVEAARAGDQGRGFAVVAGEVRNLAQRSGSAAKEIESLIRDTVDKVGRSTDMVNKTAGSLREIEVSAKNTAQIINEIASASMEQKQGINQINVAISEMDGVTQQNASLVEETAAASEEMANQAQELLEMVQNFKISDSLKSDARNNVRRELRISRVSGKAEGSMKNKSGNNNGRNKTSGDFTGPKEGSGNEKLKDTLREDGFDEF